jgi:hypothetical protein
MEDRRQQLMQRGERHLGLTLDPAPVSSVIPAAAVRAIPRSVDFPMPVPPG